MLSFNGHSTSEPRAGQEGPAEDRGTAGQERTREAGHRTYAFWAARRGLWSLWHWVASPPPPGRRSARPADEARAICLHSRAPRAVTPEKTRSWASPPCVALPLLSRRLGGQRHAQSMAYDPEKRGLSRSTPAGDRKFHPRSTRGGRLRPRSAGGRQQPGPAGDLHPVGMRGPVRLPDPLAPVSARTGG